MTAHRESLPHGYQARVDAHDALHVALDFYGFALEHVEGFIVLVSTIVCAILGGVLWFGA